MRPLFVYKSIVLRQQNTEKHYRKHIKIDFCKHAIAQQYHLINAIKGEQQSLNGSPLLSSFRKLHEQRPMVPQRGRGVVSRENEGDCLWLN